MPDAPKKTPTQILEEYSQRELQGTVAGYFKTQFADDFARLDPAGRIAVMTRLAKFVYHTLETTTLEVKQETNALEEKRAALARLARQYDADEAS